MDLSSKSSYCLFWIILNIPVTQQGAALTCDEKFQAIVDHSACLPTSIAANIMTAGVDAAEETLIVDYHNARRGEEPATNMLKLIWDEELALVAQKWTENCLYEHDDSFKRIIPGRYPLGQNIARNTGSKDWNWAMEAWYNETEFFTYNGMIPAEDIGHFTQMVWATTEKIGCGYTFCDHPGTGLSNDFHFYACNYGPPGNIGDITIPYNQGTQCAECPLSCDANLCNCTATECLNLGTRDVDTCGCSCRGSLYEMGDCALDCGTATDPSFCNDGFEQTLCTSFVNVPFDCPFLCGFCPVQGTGLSLEDNCITDLVTPCDVDNAVCTDGVCSCQAEFTQVGSICVADGNNATFTYECESGSGKTTGILRVKTEDINILRIYAISAVTPLDVDAINETDARCYMDAGPSVLVFSIEVNNDGERPCGVVEGPANTFNFAFATYSAKIGSTFLLTTSDLKFEFNCTINETVAEKALEGTIIQPTLPVVQLQNNWSVSLDVRNSAHDVITEEFVGNQAKLCVTYQTLSYIDDLTYNGVLVHSCSLSPYPDFSDSLEVIDADGCSTKEYPWPRGAFKFKSFEFIDPMFEYKACTSIGTIYRFPDQEFLYIECFLTPCMNTTTAPCGGSHCQGSGRKKRSTENSLVTRSKLRIKRATERQEQSQTLEVAPDTTRTTNPRRCLDTVVGKVIVGVLSVLVTLMLPVCVYVFYQYTHREELFQTSSSGKGLSSGRSGTDFHTLTVSNVKRANKRF